MSKTILISGGSDGLGKSIATKLTSENQVIILSHNPEKLKQVAEEIHCDFVEADVSNYDSVKSAIDTVLSKYQKIDVLINNAGVWVEGPLDQTNPEKIREIIEVNTLGTIFLTKAVLPSMIVAQNGRIINIISEDGLTAKKNKTIYSASKWAITGFTKCLLEDLHDHHIGVTGIYPGIIKTGLFKKQGVERDLTYALDPDEVAALINYVINLSTETVLPEVYIKNINNPNKMDDTNAPQIGLDLNPDMITPQNSTPQAAPADNPLKETPAPGVIDITPGSEDLSHPSKVVDITPSGVAPIEGPETTPANAPDLSASTETPAPVAPAQLTPSKDVIDITPSDAPASVDSSSGTHLSDVVPVQTTPAQAVAETPVESATEAPAETSVQTQVEISSPSEPAQVSSITTETVTAPAPDVELPPAQTNPLSEDPDTVKLGK